MSAPKKEEHFIYVNGRPVSMSDLGEAADGPIIDALQAIVDKGLAGNFPPNTPWYHVFEPNCFSAGGPPDAEQEHLHVLYREFKEYDQLCRDLSSRGELTEEHRTELQNRYRSYQAMTKLSKADET